MDNLDEKDLNGVSYEELLQIHVGVHHSLENSDDSEEDTYSSRAPVFDLQQIKAVAVNAKNFHSGDQGPSKSDEKCLEPDDDQIQKIAKNLNELMSPHYCSVCLKHTNTVRRHYSSKNHLMNVTSWIQSRTKTNDPNVTKKIFCTPCNLPFVYRIEKHYSSKTHIQNERRFCIFCFQIVKKPMKDHIYHHCVNDAQSQDLNSTTGDTLSCNRETVAKELKAKLTSTICNVCKMSLNKSSEHYRSKEHLQNMRNWIENHSYRIGIYKTNDQSSFYCEACNEVFASADLSRQHYVTMEHLKSLCTFCNYCRRHFSTILHKHFEKKHKMVILKPKATGQNLEELTQLNRCQLCTLKFKNATIAQTHYQTSSTHAIRVFDFLKINEAKFCVNSIENSTCSNPKNHLTEPFKNNYDIEFSQGFQDNGNKESESSRTESNVHLTEESNDNEYEYLDSILKDQIFNEICLMMDKSYYSNTVPLEVVLKGLKSVNRQIAGIIENNKIRLSTEKLSKRLDQNSIQVDHRLTQVLDEYKFLSSSINKSPINSADHDYAKLKLAREITRMKATLEMFSVEVALRLVHGFRTSIMNIGKNSFVVEFAFSVYETTVIYVPSVASNLLKIEMEMLERRLTKSKRISVELALEIVSQFNVRLEKEAERMKRQDKTFICEDQGCFKNTEEHAAGALSTFN